MTGNNKVQLQLSSILNVPLQSYENDFTFIVNNEEFKTSKFISDLLSPKICQNHINDPTFNIYSLNTQHTGHFSYFLRLISFDQVSIPNEEIPFISEIIEQLCNNNVNIELSNTPQITKSNFLNLIKLHESSPIFYSKLLNEDIEYISSHFYEICEEDETKKQLQQLDFSTLEKIIQNPKLLINDENQLVQFINEIYLKNQEASLLYSNVLFSNVSSQVINEFLQIFDIDHLTTETWQSISERLKQPISKTETNTKARYAKSKEEREKEQKLKQGKVFSGLNNDQFDGVFNYLRNQSNGNIDSKVNITAKSTVNDTHLPSNVVMYDTSKWYHSKDIKNNWICFEFKENTIIPTKYKLKSSSYGVNSRNPKSWVIEGSIDNNDWVILSEENDSPYLNGSYLVHLFDLSNPNSKDFKYIRMRLTGPTWFNCNYFMLDSFEIYGTLI